MKKTTLKSVKIISISLLLSIVSVVLSLYFTSQGGVFETNSLQLAPVVLGIGLLLSIPVLATLLVRVLRAFSAEEKFGPLLGKTAMFLLVILASVVILALGYGLLAVLLQAIFSSSINLGAIKQMISIATGAITVLIMPVYISAFFGYVYGEGGMFTRIQNGIRQLKHTYLKLLALMVLETFLGYLIIWVTSPGSIFFGMAIVLKTILLSLLGTAGIMISARICAPGKRELA